MGPKTSQLVAVLEQLIELLESDSEKHWSRWMKKSKQRILASDYSGIEYLLEAYGGMGSFNDLVICQSYSGGQFEWKPNHQEKNDKLNELRNKAWELADDIKREQNRT